MATFELARQQFSISAFWTPELSMNRPVRRHTQKHSVLLLPCRARPECVVWFVWCVEQMPTTTHVTHEHHTHHHHHQPHEPHEPHHREHQVNYSKNGTTYQPAALCLAQAPFQRFQASLLASYLTLLGVSWHHWRCWWRLICEMNMEYTVQYIGHFASAWSPTETSANPVLKMQFNFI